jgi:transposase-like protein
LRGALAPLLKAAPLSKSAVSRIVGTLKAELEAWRTRSLTELDAFGLYLDAIALRVRSAGKVVSLPVLAVVAIRTDGQKQLVALECCGGESFEAWKGVVDDLVARGLAAPMVCVIDGHPGMRKAVGLVWPEARVQRCAVLKLRNLERKAPKHALAEVKADFHRIVYAESAAAARAAYTAFERRWTPRCPGVFRSLHEGGEELLTFFQFPKSQWKTLRTTNVIERLHEEFRRRVKTQGSLPTEDAALALLFRLIVSGQIRLRRLDGWRQIPAVLRARREVAA